MMMCVLGNVSSGNFIPVPYCCLCIPLSQGYPMDIKHFMWYLNVIKRHGGHRISEAAADITYCFAAS